jgi:diguanylate cyclase
VFKQPSDILLQSCRSVDIVSRNGGEEFSVILPSCDQFFAKMVAERIRTTVERCNFMVDDNQAIKITVSIGVYTVTDYGSTTIEDMIQRADEGLYVAKQSGRNRICSNYSA